MAEFENAEEVDVVDEDSVAAESCFARKLASFGMVAGSYYTPGRIQSEAHPNQTFIKFPHGLGLQFMPLSYPRHTTVIFVA
jgi:hypothetical protein